MSPVARRANTGKLDGRRPEKQPVLAWLCCVTVSLLNECVVVASYRRVLRACALVADVDILPDKDRTELGDKVAGFRTLIIIIIIMCTCCMI